MRTRLSMIASLLLSVSALQACPSHGKAATVSQVIQDETKGNPFVISADKVDDLMRTTGLSRRRLMQELIGARKSLARPPISQYYVGVVGLGASGNLYLGVNLEFPGMPLTETVHAEQFMLTLARSYGETELLAIALSAAPCGFCRQFISEIGEKAGEIRVLTPNSEGEFAAYLPHAFGPNDLELEGGLLSATEVTQSNCGCPLAARAIDAAKASYAPYTQAHSGVAILLADGSIFSGSYLENAAYNPSLSPLQTALIDLVAGGRQYEDIVEVVLIELSSAVITHEPTTRAILRSIAPQARLNTVTLDTL